MRRWSEFVGEFVDERAWGWKSVGRGDERCGAMRVIQEAGLASLREEEGVRSRLSALHFWGFLSGEAMVAQAPAPLVALLLSPPSPARPWM